MWNENDSRQQNYESKLTRTTTEAVSDWDLDGSFHLALPEIARTSNTSGDHRIQDHPAAQRLESTRDSQDRTSDSRRSHIARLLAQYLPSSADTATAEPGRFSHAIQSSNLQNNCDPQHYIALLTEKIFTASEFR